MRLRSIALAICTATVLTACGTSTATPTPTHDAVRADLDALIRAGAVGAIATLTENGVTTVLTAGHANLAARTPIPTDQPLHVRVGSVTKSFTAAIALRLAAERELDLDEPVDTYLPGLLAGDGVDGRAITVRHILGHRSGLPTPAPTPDLNEAAAARDGRTFTPPQEIALALREPARFAPGTRFEYSNTNYIVAGMLIEAVTGRPYPDVLRDRVLSPLGLTRTYLPATGETGLRDPHLTGYATVDGRVTEATRIEPSLPWTSGALVSTGAELNRFFTALAAGQVVPSAELAQMLDGSDMGRGDGFSYGLGLAYTELPCGARSLGHVGGVHGFSTIAGATATGRAVTFSVTGAPDTVDIRAMLTHALCD
ncbi:serine hydrolase domain-containing protein [Nocardia neocaledoniensis]|uniref:serine hydrolase domain-containing protein n=1 Tax=Nocardia neocaledoniensis TaxID=236511 RepID=UPI002454B8BA|nr:serine hydrolase domain-containing protein [Nocardia neocaledoniensis]